MPDKEGNAKSEDQDDAGHHDDGDGFNGKTIDGNNEKFEGNKNSYHDLHALFQHGGSAEIGQENQHQRGIQQVIRDAIVMSNRIRGFYITFCKKIIAHYHYIIEKKYREGPVSGKPCVKNR